MADWLMMYRDGSQNGRPYPVNSVWTRGKGSGFPGIARCRDLGLLTSEPDDKFNPRGWRHDITPAGRTALSQHQGGTDG
jgi:hypothetical protein